MRSSLLLTVCLTLWAATALATDDERADHSIESLAAESLAQPKVVVVARVGADEITVPELLGYASSNPKLLGALVNKETKGQVLGAVIVSRLILQAAQSEGLLEADYTEVELQLAVAELKRRHFTVKDTPTEQDLRAYYEDNKARYSTPPAVRLSQILFAVGQDGDESLRTAAYRRAEGALARLTKGEAFDELASELTENETLKSVSGDVGFFPLDERQWYFGPVSTLAVGEHSGIVDTEVGYQILQVTDRREGSVIPFEQVAAKVANRWMAEQERRLRDAYIVSLAEQIPVTIEIEDYAAAHPLLPGFTYIGGDL